MSPWRARSICTEPGCPAFAEHRGKCAAHALRAQRAYDASRGSRQERGYGPGWETVRAAVLERDRYLCQIRGPRCSRIATTVDHIRPVLAGGDRLDPANLRASCVKCNYGHAGQTTNRTRT